jgi:hypothetical protein
MYTSSERQSVTKVKSCIALLRMLLVYIHSCPKSVLRYKFLIWGTSIAALYIYVTRIEDLWLFFEHKRGPSAKEFWKH